MKGLEFEQEISSLEMPEELCICLHRSMLDLQTDHTLQPQLSEADPMFVAVGGKYTEVEKPDSTSRSDLYPAS